MLIGVLINTNRLFGCGKATGKVFIVLSSPPNHLEVEGKEGPPCAQHRDHDHLSAPLHALCAGQGAARRNLSRRDGGRGDRRSFLRGFPAHGDPAASAGAVDGKRHATGGQRRSVGMDRHRRSRRPKLGRNAAISRDIAC